MLSDLHEEIVDEIRDALLGIPVDHPFRQRYAGWRLGVVLDPQMGNMLLGVRRATGGGRTGAADAYIFPEDGGGGIAVEVGRMPDGKWNFVINGEDDKPIRVLRVGFDLSLSIIRPRSTQFEADLLQRLQEHLPAKVGT